MFKLNNIVNVLQAENKNVKCIHETELEYEKNHL